MNKIYFIALCSIYIPAISSCPLLITNDAKEQHDIIIADERKATLIRFNRKGKVGVVGKSALTIYTANKKSKDSNDFVIAYLITEKECPSDEEITKNKKINQLSVRSLVERSKIDLDQQKNDMERFIVEDVTIKKKGPK